MKINYFYLRYDLFALSAKRTLANNGIYHLIFFLTLLAPLSSNRQLNFGQANQTLSIGQIQGPGQVSPYLGKTVKFQGVVTGHREDRNLQGIRYYTLFMQDLAEHRDSAVSTSDGIAVFLGRKRPAAKIGDVVTVSGLVTEYYGLTEIDDKGLKLSIDGHGYPLPAAIELNPPEEVTSAFSYFERLEGMLVKMKTGIVVGPTHEGCGFSVIHQNVGKSRIMKHKSDADVGQIVGILNWTDVDCGEFPGVQVGDKVYGLEGPLTYHFEEYKLIQQREGQLNVENQEQISQDLRLPSAHGEIITLATFNLHNYFDTKSDTGDPVEPILLSDELELKQKKLTYTIVNILQCPTILAVQEVETSTLLHDLVTRLAGDCNFAYTVSHRDSADVRGADVALLTDPRFVHVTSLMQHQSCTDLETGIIDPTANCLGDSEPLFSRQILQVDLKIDQFPISIFVVHFKSKRGGEDETEPRRLAQAEVLSQIVEKLSSNNQSQGVIILGDFNDYYQSPVMTRLRSNGLLIDHFELLAENQRYSYIFDGASQLIDGILVSQNLADKIVQTHICHVNADYPVSYASAIDEDRIALRSSDHDIPMIAIQLKDEATSDLEPSQDQGLRPTQVSTVIIETVESMVEVKPIVPKVLPTLTAPSTLEFQPEGSLRVKATTSVSVHVDELEPSSQSKDQWPTILLLVLAVLMFAGIWFARRVW